MISSTVKAQKVGRKRSTRNAKKNRNAGSRKNPGVTGTKEWARSNRNCLLGCPHRCRYCYARDMAKRNGFIKSFDEWGDSHLHVREKEVNMGRRKVKGTIMFPSSHDIVPKFLTPCMTLLGKLLKAGNDVLVVSKPHLECIEAICKEFAEYRKQMLFRFTITAMDEELLKFWEPGAPQFAERLTSLKHAFENGFRTSVSVEPMLDTANIMPLYDALICFVSETIWFGKMSRVRHCVQPSSSEEAAVQRIEEGQTDAKIREVYAALKDKAKVRWKDSIKKVVGIELAAKAGLDI